MTMTEAPVSFNAKAVSPAGYDCMLTLRGEESSELMARALKALEWLSAQGFRPTGYAPAAAPAAAGEGGSTSSNGSPPLCPAHQQAMKPSKFGGWYCPVKVADDDGTGKAVYCKQRIGE